MNGDELTRAIKQHCKTLFCIVSLFAISYAQAQANNFVSLDLTGKIESHCDITYHKQELGNIFENQNQKVGFDVNCNSPFEISIYSKNGGLKRGREIITYDINVNIDNKKKIYPSKQLTNSKSLSYDINKKFLTRGSLSFETNSTPIFAGKYSDTLIVSFVPKLTL
ncbi:hypothetical protein [Thaumasiovibrio sp. DFM-14]|uniref:hypothetical protein n=1 Tax=Thaumasiovibrio sp. DFM-14 TaxID=3384792 RepID=UPI0039A265F3